MSLIAMVVLLAMTGFTIDFGHAYLVQRQLQSAADAAVLAGALELPDGAAATGAANDFGPASGSANEPSASDNATLTVTLKCLQSLPGCPPGSSTYNAVNAQATSTVKTVFAKLVGLDSLKVQATATACSPCKAKQLDIVLVLDRTGSMCQFTNGSPDPSCKKLNNAVNGMKTFLTLMDPQYDHVGLAVLPPATGTTRADHCAMPTAANYDSPTARYLLVGLSDDFASPAGTLNNGSTLVDRINCQQGGGRTGYASAIDAAQTELLANGRQGVQKVIVFLSDGAANYGGLSEPASYRDQPCRQGISSADAAKNDPTTKTLVYSIGYDLNGSSTVYEACRRRNNSLETPGMNAYQAMQGIASAPDTFYNEPDAVQLNTIFTSIASDIFRTASLIDDDTP